LNIKVIGFGCGPWRWYKGVGEIHTNKGGVGEERRGKETDRCPLTNASEARPVLLRYEQRRRPEVDDIW
jgi:hypothetical protein